MNSNNENEHNLIYTLVYTTVDLNKNKTYRINGKMYTFLPDFNAATKIRKFQQVDDNTIKNIDFNDEDHTPVYVLSGPQGGGRRKKSKKSRRPRRKYRKQTKRQKY